MKASDVLVGKAHVTSTGFCLGAGPPGSINHKRAHDVLKPLTPSAFRKSGKAVGLLAQELIDKSIVPSEELRPETQREEPEGLLEGAAAAFKTARAWFQCYPLRGSQSLLRAE